jgi:general secretion pathway protein K
VAIVTALVLAALAITLVTSLFGQQNVQVRSIENQRLQLQKQWVIRGALDWARLILREDARVNHVDYIGEPWSVPLGDTRLDQYLDNGRDSSDATDATLSGYVIDAQSRLNLTNLAASGIVDPKMLAAFERLLTAQGMDPGLATSVAQTVASSQSQAAQFNPDGSVGAAAVSAKVLALTQVDDLLVVTGFTPASVAKLKDLVVFLPVQTSININTASAQVISARIAGISLSDAEQLVTARDRAYFKDSTDLGARWVNSKVPIPTVTEVNTQTNYFIVHGKVRIDRSALDVDALVERTPVSGNTRIVWIREN